MYLTALNRGESETFFVIPCLVSSRHVVAQILDSLMLGQLKQGTEQGSVAEPETALVLHSQLSTAVGSAPGNWAKTTCLPIVTD